MVTDFAGRVAIVTGSGSGIGAATARSLAKRGARVVVSDLSLKRARQVSEEIVNGGGESVARKVDVGIPDQVDELISESASLWGRLDVLVNNAGYGFPKELHEQSLEEWNQTIGVTLSGTFYGIRFALPLMRSQNSGSIVNTSSICGLRGDYELGAYNAAKAGVVNLTRSAAIENARYGIRVNCVCPGTIRTRVGRLYAGDKEEEFFSEKARLHPIGRIGEPEEVAAVICFLAGDESSFVTGAAYAVDGGLTAHTGLADVQSWY